MGSTTTSEKDNDLLFVDSDDHQEEEPTSFSCGDPRWKVLIIDDEKVVHDVSQLVLKDFSYKQRGLELIHGYTGEDARQLIKKHPDAAIMLLDVVMESDSAGLDAVKYIRDNLQNRTVRIILRTGQPGQAPEHKVIRFYDINDYLDKSRITAATPIKIHEISSV